MKRYHEQAIAFFFCLGNFMSKKNIAASLTFPFNKLLVYSKKKMVSALACFISTVAVFNNIIKGIVHLKIKILSSFTHPQVVSTLFEFLSSAEHKRRYFEEC